MQAIAYLAMILTGLIFLAILGSVLIKINKSSEKFLLDIIGIFSLMTSILGFIIFIFTAFEFISAGSKAEVLNKEFNTSYTQEQIFFASDVIKEIRYLRRNQIELNGDLIRGKE